MSARFAELVIKSVLVCYAAWGSVVIGDLVVCEYRKPGTCESQRAEVRGAAAAIPGTLLAWLADSPLTSKSNSKDESFSGKKSKELDS